MDAQDASALARAEARQRADPAGGGDDQVGVPGDQCRLVSQHAMTGQGQAHRLQFFQRAVGGVHTRVPVHLKVDQARDRDGGTAPRQTDSDDHAVVDGHVARHQYAVHESGADAEPLPFRATVRVKSEVRVPPAGRRCVYVARGSVMIGTDLDHGQRLAQPSPGGSQGQAGRGQVLAARRH